jgi:hypothetical protein
MTKPLQGMALRTMTAELTGCQNNYKYEEDILASNKMKPDTAQRTVTWKRIVATPFKTPQECVGVKCYITHPLMDCIALNC